MAVEILSLQVMSKCLFTLQKHKERVDKSNGFIECRCIRITAALKKYSKSILLQWDFFSGRIKKAGIHYGF